MLSSPAPKRNIDLDFLRGLAILAVIGFHLHIPPTTHRWLSMAVSPFERIGYRGVDLFFVLSGFLVGGLLLKEYRRGPVQRGRFLLRRILKIWPAYYAFIAIQIITVHHPLNTFVFQNLFHVQNYLHTSLSQTWSLAIEEHFYLALALFLGWASRRQLSPTRLLQIFSSTCVIALFLRILDVHRGRLSAAHDQTQNRIDSLLFGVMLAVLFWMFSSTFDKLTRNRWPLVAVTLAAVILMFWLPQYPVWDLTIGYTLIPLGLTAFLALVYRHAGPFNEWLAYRFIAWIGLYSYGIYLWFSITREPMHRLILHLRTDLPVIWVSALLLQFAAAILIGLVMTRVIEVPFLRAREKFFPMEIKGGQREPSAALAEINDPGFPLSSSTGKAADPETLTIA